MKVREIAGIIAGIAPPDLAEAWDNAGLLVGDPEAEPGWVAVALDAAFALSAAGGSGTGALGDGSLPGPGPGLLVTHHPVPFRPLKRVLATDPAGGIVLALARRGVALYAAHTSYDAAPGGLSHQLAQAVGLAPEGLRPLVDLAPAAGADGATFFKLVVFVPAPHLEAVRAALVAAGAGFIGNYSETAFAAPGRGYFRPLSGADPYVGTVGRLEEEVAEVRLETIVPRHRLKDAIREVIAAHPYEEPVYDVYPLAGHPAVTRPELMAGLGRVGDLAGGPVSLGRFRVSVEKALDLPAGSARVLGGVDKGPLVHRVAVCPGAGGDYAALAAAAGAGVLVTGDVTYHQVVDAARLEVVLIDAGHLGTEKAFVPAMASALTKSFETQGISLRVSEVPTPSSWLG